MATNYPGTAIDVFTNPASGAFQNSPSHSSLHTNAQDAIAALETKVGINGSAVTTTVDFKLSGIPATDKAASKTGTETLTNKTLTTPTINGGTIDNPTTLNVDTITGHTSSTIVTVASLQISNGVLNTNNSVVGSNIASYNIRRSNNGSNITETTAKKQSGWICGQPGVNPSISFTVTFPVAFTNVPIVVATYGGDTAAVTSTLGAGGANVKHAVAEAVNVTTTGFTLITISRDNTNWAANNTVYAHWIAEGV